MADALKNAKSIAVLDRSQSIGTFPPLYTEVLSSMYNVSSIKNKNNQSGMIHDTRYMIQSYIYGLGGRDILQADIEKVFADLKEGKVGNKIKYIQ